jgi:hypothetical protein
MPLVQLFLYGVLSPKHRLWSIVSYSFIFEIFLYIYYESTIPPEINIRVDLLLILPAIALSILISVLSLYKSAKNNKGEGG